MISIKAIPAFQDNYIWLLYNSENQQAICIDPGCADMVLQTLDQLQVRLTHILITHHHADHTGGLLALKKNTGAIAVGPGTIQGIDHAVVEKDLIKLPGMGCTLNVLEIPGHTLDHIAYYNAHWLFCGDTLFSIGCGRVFEGTQAQMFEAMNKLAALPDELTVFPAHEYTESNIRFAESVDAKNLDLKAYKQTVSHLRQKQQPSLPTTLAIEKNCNPFLRCRDANFLAHLEKLFQRDLTPSEAFCQLRQMKDNF